MGTEGSNPSVSALTEGPDVRGMTRKSGPFPLSELIVWRHFGAIESRLRSPATVRPRSGWALDGYGTIVVERCRDAIDVVVEEVRVRVERHRCRRVSKHSLHGLDVGPTSQLESATDGRDGSAAGLSRSRCQGPLPTVRMNQRGHPATTHVDE